MVASEFGTLRKGRQHSSKDSRADSAHGGSLRASEQGLRRGFQAVGGDACLGEHVTFDVSGYGCTCQAATGPPRIGRIRRKRSSGRADVRDRGGKDLSSDDGASAHGPNSQERGRL